MGLVDEILTGPICLDTCLFIYYIEEEPRYIDLVAKIFEAIDIGLFTAVTSGITLLETLVIPFRAKDEALALQYQQILTESRGITLFDLDRNILLQASKLRANFNIKTPDAIQLAVALQERCSTFITNDRKLPQVPGLKIIQLSDYL